MTCLVEIRIVYGRELIYPANDTAETLLKLIGRKTFSREELDLIKSQLGFSIEVKQREL